MQTAMALNEFLAPRWQNLDVGGMSASDAILGARQLPRKSKFCLPLCPHVVFVATAVAVDISCQLAVRKSTSFDIVLSGIQPIMGRMHAVQALCL